MFQTLTSFLALLAFLIACKTRSYNPEAVVQNRPGVSYSAFEYSLVQKGAKISLLFSEYDRSTYAFEPILNTLDQKPQYDGRDLFCFNFVEALPSYPGAGGSIELVNHFESLRFTAKIFCWDNFAELPKDKLALPWPWGAWDSELFAKVSRVKCAATSNDTKVKCTRLNWYDESFTPKDLHKGPILAVGPVNGQPANYADSQVTVRPGLKIDAVMSFDGMTQFDGGDLFCSNKYLVSYRNYDFPTRYVQDAFARVGGIYTFVRCYLTKEELLRNLDNQGRVDTDVKSGSLVNCPKVTTKNAKIQCRFVEEVSK